MKFAISNSANKRRIHELFFVKSCSADICFCRSDCTFTECDRNLNGYLLTNYLKHNKEQGVDVTYAVSELHNRCSRYNYKMPKNLDEAKVGDIVYIKVMCDGKKLQNPYIASEISKIGSKYIYLHPLEILQKEIKIDKSNLTSTSTKVSYGNVYFTIVFSRKESGDS